MHGPQLGATRAGRVPAAAEVSAADVSAADVSAADVSAGRVYRFLAAALAVTLVLVVGAGLGWGWAWTGFPENGTLWAWLSLLALPLALTVLPVWLKTRRGHSRVWRIGLSIAAVVFLAVIVGGYAFRWSWVGFYPGPGETVQLWDWLTTLVQPVVIVLIPFWLKLGRAGVRQSAVVTGSALGVFLLLVICGYAVPWEWTGFGDQKLWDWIQSFLLPFALPIALVALDVEALRSRRGPAPNGPSSERGAPGAGARVRGGPGS